MVPSSSDSDRAQAVILLVTALAFALAPFLSPSFAGFDPDDFPIPQVDPPAVPAGYAFAIWGVIYLWLIAHAAFGLLARGRDPAWRSVRLPLFLSLGTGVTWLMVARASPVTATAMILVMLFGALLALLRTPRQDPWLLAGPIALYAGWLTAASAVSIALVGGGHGVLFTAEVWAWIALGLAAATGVAVIWGGRVHPAYALALLWALAAVAVRNGLSALSGAALLAGIALLALSLWRRRA
ncbi:MAG: hypothetical protein AAGI50_18165 [Pseudomonadota bacterium]